MKGGPEPAPRQSIKQNQALIANHIVPVTSLLPLSQMCSVLCAAGPCSLVKVHKDCILLRLCLSLGTYRECEVLLDAACCSAPTFCTFCS